MSRIFCVAVLVLLSASCGQERSDFCAQIEEENAACVDPNVLASCEEANDECPGSVSVQESCPLQFGCPG